MRLPAVVLTLLSLALLPHAAHADTLDNISVVGTGNDLEFTLPSSVTAPYYAFDQTYNFWPLNGTVNGVPTTLGLLLVFPGEQGVASDTFVVSDSSTYLELALPDLYTVSLDNVLAQTATLNFISGSYPTFAVGRLAGSTPGPYTITITPQAASATPEPSSLLLLATALLGVAYRFRRLAHP